LSNRRPFVPASAKADESGGNIFEFRLAYTDSRVNLKEENAMNLTIQLPDEEVPVLKAKATARGVSEEQYVLQVLEQDLAAAVEPQAARRRFDNLSDLLLSSPFAGANLDLDRSRDQPRTIDLG
jgi:hypothetical protein